jgi:hypothetical protein
MKYVLALVVAASLGLGLLACGGGSGEVASRSQTATTSQGAVGGQTQTSTPSGTSAKTSPPPPTGGSSGAGKAAGGKASHPSAEEGFPPPAPRHERYPHGDRSIQEYGAKAPSSDTAAIAGIVKRYYAAVAAGDGSRACALMSTEISRTIVATFANSPALRGKGCSSIVQALYKIPAGRARAAFAKVQVTSVRVKGDRAFALLRSPSSPSGEMPMLREGGAWKVNALMGSNLPS